VTKRTSILRWGACSLLVGASFCGCGSTTGAAEQGAPDAGTEGGTTRGGVGIIALNALNGKVGVDFYFAAYRDCDRLPREDDCQLLYAASCWPAVYSPPLRLTNAGTVTVSDGKTVVSYPPNADGFYGKSEGGPLDPLLPLRVVAQGEGVPPFEAEVVVPREPIALVAPSRGEEISRSVPLGVNWSGTTDGARAEITVQGGGDDPRTITCEPTASASAFEIPARFLGALEPGKLTVIGVAPANLVRLSVGDWSIDVIAYGLGGGHSITVVP
jgi:hypothetical protein